VGNKVSGKENFVATVIWQKMFSPKNIAAHLWEDHDCLLVFAQLNELWQAAAS